MEIMKTALEMSHSERKKRAMTAARESFRLQSAQSAVSDSSECNDLLAIVREVAGVLKRDFGASRVVLFGSLSHQAWWSEHSDIDIAVDGIKGAAYWQAWHKAEEMLPQRKIDLVDLQMTTPGMKKSIDYSGIEL